MQELSHHWPLDVIDVGACWPMVTIVMPPDVRWVGVIPGGAEPRAHGQQVENVGAWAEPEWTTHGVPAASGATLPRCTTSPRWCRSCFSKSQEFFLTVICFLLSMSALDRCLVWLDFVRRGAERSVRRWRRCRAWYPFPTRLVERDKSSLWLSPLAMNSRFFSCVCTRPEGMCFYSDIFLSTNYRLTRPLSIWRLK